MRHSRGILAALLIVGSASGAEAADAAEANKEPAFRFRNVAYFHRWSQKEQHEYTPEKQENLDKWTDMVTINGYPDVHDGEALAAKANAVLENYKAHQAMVLKTDSIPRTADRPAEHLIAVVFGRPAFIEVAFARLRLADGTGCSVVYSHRIYGEKVGEQMSAWLKANGATTEKALMEWKSAPASSRLDRAEVQKAAISIFGETCGATPVVNPATFPSRQAERLPYDSSSARL